MARGDGDGTSRRRRRAPAPKRGSALRTYQELRDFESTSEPTAQIRPSATGRSFVVQQHAATAMHYDFRLELDGVLKSWAIPKGPSLSPTDKRLAVQTEDHPVDYRDFEGSIPEDQYGGGPVIVWDRGEWQPKGNPDEGLQKGRLEFSLRGEKLHGAFVLVRMPDRQASPSRKKKDTWLLIKRRDSFARDDGASSVVTRLPRSVLTDRTIEDIEAGAPALPKRTTSKEASTRARTAKMPRFGAIEPQLATLVGAVPVAGPTTVGDWIYEIKYDGYRAITTLDHGEVQIASRNGKDWTSKFPEIAEAVSRIRAKQAVFDGEIAYVLPDGRTDFQHLQNALGAAAKERAQIVYFVFDLLYFDGVDLRDEPLITRKDTLRTILAYEKPPLRLADHVDERGETFFTHACKAGLEGIIAKRADRPHVSGRGRDWVKVKCQKRQEFAIVGFTPPKGSRSGIGALLLAVHRGGRYQYAGKVGTGFTARTLQDLRKRLDKLTDGAKAPDGAPRMKDAVWVEPKLVGEVRFTEWTKDGVLRHPSFEGLRIDKKPAEVVRETGDNRVLGITITHPERIVDRTLGLTKLDLARYHEAVAERLLAFAKKRPLMLVRCTESWTADKLGPLQGTKAKRACFVQKHGGRGLTANIGHSDVEGEEVLYVQKPREVIELVQFNAIELHGWGSTLPRFDRPDWIVFDLDPDEALGFDKVVEAALALRASLGAIGLVSFVKTTGGKGLHVVVPLNRRDGWEAVRTFAEDVARAFAEQASDKYVANMSKAKRRGKVFIDYLRNAQGATAVLPYSPRARPGTPVAMPVAWNDLEHLDPRELDVFSVPKLLAKQKKDPWAGLLQTSQSLGRAKRAKTK
ncbi:ATP-dependent DNA ligase [Labilithrix luteola]|uniref:DNA ligase (ATP) n=1 Tax=Labilithrix luteola TaxID=1391654 RepID=A0A0K1QB33_9BACT|nr:DNA ligase D [Labilithrix luteola]AKV02943.1 ATP-dependent DNA ligase [Labilithrix luteola]